MTAREPRVARSDRGMEVIPDPVGQPEPATSLTREGGGLSRYPAASGDTPEAAGVYAQPGPFSRTGQCVLETSASVLSALVTESSPKPVASDRASIRSTLLLTTPASVTRPFSTMMWIGGFGIDA